MSIAMDSLYSTQAASRHNEKSGADNTAPDARVIGSTASGEGQPAFSWVALVATLVVIRVLQEMAE